MSVDIKFFIREEPSRSDYGVPMWQAQMFRSVAGH